MSTFPGLSQTFVIDQVAAFRAAGLDVRVLASVRADDGAPGAKGRDLIPIATFADQYLFVRLLGAIAPQPLREKLRGAALWRLLRAAAEENDLVLCHFGPNGLRTARATRGLNDAAPIWTIFHGYDLSREIQQRGRQFYAPLFQAGDRFLPISRLWMARLIDLGCPQDKVRLLRMGVDCEAIPFAPHAYNPGDAVKIISVGRLVEKKGTEDALRALGVIRDQFPDLNWSLSIVGDGPLEPRLRRIAEEAGINERVEFAGSRSADEVRSSLTRSHIFVLPSVTASDGDMEGIPVALMEAMAVGVPVVSTFHSGIPELVEHEVSGLLAPERDVPTLAAHLRALIVDAEMRAALAKAARASVEREFSQKQIYRDFIEDIIAAAKREK